MRHLFMRDSENARTLQKLFVLLFGVIFILIPCDWILGRLIPNITSEPPYILRFENVPGVEALWNFSAADIKPVVFTGSSQIYTGMSPHLFNDQIKAISAQNIHSVNVSIFGSVAIIQRDLIRNLIIPNHPQVIIYGIEMRALLPASQDENKRMVSDFRNKDLGYAVSRPSSIERNLLLWLLQYSTLFKYRDNFREWLTSTPLMIQAPNTPASADDLGYAPFPNTFSQNAANITSQFIPFTETDKTRQLMLDIGETCKQNEVRCILLNMPIHQLAYQYITPPEEVIYQRLLRETALPIWDFNTESCRKILGDTAFFNLNHLNSKGAEMFSQMVADTYAKVFFNVAETGDANCAQISP